MKRNNRWMIFLLLAVLCTLSSCKKFLNTQPSDFIPPGNYYETGDQLQRALNGVYSRLEQAGLYGANMWSYFDMADDFYWSLVSATSTPPDMGIYRYSASDPSILSLWQTLYKGIGDANVLLQNIDRPDMDENERKVIQGETLFLRAYYYFILVSNFGYVPLTLEPITSPSGNDLPASSVKDVYNQILKDMETAEGLVLPIDEIGYGGRISKSAVRAVLARVNLYMAGYPLNDKSRLGETVKWAGMVMNDPVHHLNPDFTDIFKRYARDEYDIAESIWEVEFWGNRSDSYVASGQLGSRNGIENRSDDSDVGFAYGQISTTARLYHRFEEGDVRRDWAIAPYKYNSSGQVVNMSASQIYERNCGKWRREYEVVIPKNKNYTPQNFPLVRFSDVLLMYAEAENELNGPEQALPALNLVRERAHASTFASTDQEEVRQEIRDERSRELCFEGLRKMDLIRWGVFLDTMYELGNEIASDAPASRAYAANGAKNVSERHLLLPIPVYELSLNRSLNQNPNW